MGRGRKCNWKRKLKKANKKGKINNIDHVPGYVISGKKYFDLNYSTPDYDRLNQLFKSEDIVMIKNRRGGYVVGYNSESDAKKVYDTTVAFMKARRPGHDAMRAIYDAMKKSLEEKVMENNHKLKGTAPDYTRNFITPDGRYIDPELGDVNPNHYKELWESLSPKMDSKRIGIPMVFGTSGSIDNPHWAHDIWKDGIKDDKLFLPAGSYHEEAGPFPVVFGKSKHGDYQHPYFDVDINDIVGDVPALPKDFFEYDPNGRNK